MKQPNLVWSIIILVVFAGLLIWGGMWAKKHPVPMMTEQQTIESQLAGLTEPVKQVIVEGEGEGAVAGDIVSVNYVGALSNGTVFDTNIKEIAVQAGLDQEGRTYEPYSFTLGSTGVISGWNVAVTGMKKGEIAQVILPASYAYGAEGFGPIPPNSPLIFQIEVVDIAPPLDAEPAE